MANEKLKLYARGKGVAQWEIAEALSISEPTLTRMLRVPLDKVKEKNVKKAIDDIYIKKEGK